MNNSEFDDCQLDAATLQRISVLDEKLVKVAKGIKVLSALAWPGSTQERFLEQWSQGNLRLPSVSYPTLAFGEQSVQLKKIHDEAREIEHPLGDYLRATASSYLTAVSMLGALGTPHVTEFSVALYGKPGDELSGGKGKTSVDAARYFLRVADEFYRRHPTTEHDFCVPASVVKKRLEARLPEVFDDARVEVMVDRNLVAKAAAGATRVRLRDATCFSEYDVEQLLQHEAYVHSLTARNGQNQTRIRTLGFGAPRTTAAQEGLATFAELISGAIDIARLERIALRIIAIDMALSGADFVESFKFFLDSGQPPTESFNSTMRVFRGVPVCGGSAFTKDGVYLHGLLEVHTFFRWAMRHQKQAVPLVFCRSNDSGRRDSVGPEF